MSVVLKLDGKSYEAFHLAWDTDYFSVNSAKVLLKDNLSEEDQDRVINYSESFDFVTITNLGNRNQNNIWIGKKLKAFLADMNIQFIKQVSNDPELLDDTINIYYSFPRNETVLQIAKKTFLYSRFFNDSGLPSQLAHNIYVHWTECAFDKPDKYFVIRKINDEIAGYLLFSINMDSSVATMELMAVDDKFRGKSVGKSLTAGLESFAYKRGIRLIKVGTQADNVSAARFYTANGFKYESCSSVYHYWPNR